MKLIIGDFFLLVAKSYERERTLGYRIKLVLPDTGPFAILTPIQRSAIEAEVLAAIKTEAASEGNLISHNARAETAGLDKLMDFIRQIQAGSLMMTNPWSQAGFIMMPIAPGESMGRKVGGPPQAPINYPNLIIHDYAGLEFGNSEGGHLLSKDIKDGAQALSLPEEVVLGFNYAYIITDDFNSIPQMEEAVQKFDQSQERIVIWLHHSINNNGVGFLFG